MKPNKHLTSALQWLLLLTVLCYSTATQAQSKKGSFDQYNGKYINTGDKNAFYYFEQTENGQYRLVNQLATSFEVMNIDIASGEIWVLTDEDQKLSFGFFTKRKDGRYQLKVKQADGGMSHYKIEEEREEKDD